MSTEDADRLRLQLIRQVLNLPTDQLSAAESFLARLTTSATPLRLPSHPAGSLAATTLAERDWPHAPLHRLCEQGTYIVTSSTYQKAHYFQGPERLHYLEAKLLSCAKAFGWQLEAWAVFSNH